MKIRGFLVSPEPMLAKVGLQKEQVFERAPLCMEGTSHQELFHLSPRFVPVVREECPFKGQPWNSFDPIAPSPRPSFTRKIKTFSRHFRRKHQTLLVVLARSA
ncbi:MAG TPA: hypothetical protein VGF13_04905 [Verrucomicrobiae bacterium]